MNERSTKSEPTTQDNGALHFGPTAGAATPAAVEAAMPQRDGAAQRRGDIASLVSGATSRRSRARPERTIVIELAADLISSFCEAHRR